MIQTKFVEK